MINFSQEILNQSTSPKKINFLFQTLTKSIKRINNLWEIEVDKGRCIRTENLILSSSLLAHPRCLEILQINSVPLRDAFIPGEDVIVDSVLREIKKQNYISRKIYIFHISNSAVVQNFNNQYLHIRFSKVIMDNLNFERIIFQRQSDGSMILALHCFYISNLINSNSESVVNSLRAVFENHQRFLDLFLQARLIDTMDWRASQPLNGLLPKQLQWSQISKIGFCGDWFDLNSSSGLETAMKSAIRLVKLIN